MAEIRLLDGVREVGAEAWNALVGDASPFLEWEWLASLEEAGCVGEGTGWGPRPMVAFEGDRLVAAAPVYVKGHSMGEFVFDHGWADAAARAGIEYYPKLLVGVPFTPVGGARILVAPDQPRDAWVSTLGKALVDICDSNEISGVHVNFCEPEEVEPLRKSGYELRVGVQYQWHNHDYGDFDDYLAAFRSKRRNQIKRERRQLQESGVEIRALHGDAITDDLFEPMYRFYLSTIEARYWGHQYLNPEFFSLLRDRFKSRLTFVVAYEGETPIAGTTNIEKGNALYGRYWGADKFVRHLHFNVCYYAAVEHCIRAGLDRFEPGAGGDYKQLRGFDAQPTWSVHYLGHPGLRKAVGEFLARERESAMSEIEWLHDHSALKST